MIPLFKGKHFNNIQDNNIIRSYFIIFVSRIRILSFYLIEL